MDRPRCWWCVMVMVLVLLVQAEKIRHQHADDADADAACPNCLFNERSRPDDDDDFRSERLEAIKRQILSKLGLRHKPNVTYPFPREIIMETLFRAEDSDGFMGGFASSGTDDDDMSTTSARTGAGVLETVDVDDFYGRTSEIISFAEQGYRVNGNRLLEFRVSPESSGAGWGGGGAGQEFRVRAATFWLKADVRRPRSPNCKSTDIYVFKFISSLGRSVKINSKEFGEVTMEPIAVPLDERKPGWQKIEVTATVRDWLEGSRNSRTQQQQDDRLRLFVDCSCCANWDVHLVNSAGAGVQDRPFLVIHTEPRVTRRVRRRALDCDSLDLEQQHLQHLQHLGQLPVSPCCKQRFYVSFRTLGWDDWIIAPHGYHANYCRGECGAQPRTPDSFVTYHTHVLEEARKTHRLTGMQPCCAPLKFSSMSLIYFGPDSNIIKRDLPKMVVDECGCP